MTQRKGTAPQSSNNKPDPANNRVSRSVRQLENSPQNKVKLNPDNPVPWETSSNFFSFSGGDQYVPFLGNDDRFAATLFEARLLSPTQFACINTKNRYLVGNGVVIKNLKDGTPEDPLWKAIKDKANNRRQGLDKILELVFDGHNTTGNAPVEFVRGKVGNKPFVYCYVHSMLDARLAPPNDNGEIEFALISKRFRKSAVLQWKDDDKFVKRIPLYKTNRRRPADNWIQDGKVERTIVWIKNDVAGFDVYGMPSSIASLIHQVLEYDHARFDKDNIDNNMIAGAAIFLKGGITQPEADRIAGTIIKRHTGAGRRGRVAVFASPDGIDSASVVNLDTHKDGSYIEANKVCESKIILANDWDAVLAGLQSENALGKGSGYLKEIYEQKLRSVIIPLQQEIKKEFFPVLKEIYREHMGAKWDDLDFDFDPIVIDNKTAEAATTVKGLLAFLDIIKLVASGAYELEAAVQLVISAYGKSDEDARKMLGTIKIVPKDVLPQSNRPENADNTGGDPAEN